VDVGLASLEQLTADEAAGAIAELAEAGAPSDRLAAALGPRASAMGTQPLVAALLAVCFQPPAAAEGVRLAANVLAARAPLRGLGKDALLGLAVTAAKCADAAPALSAAVQAAATAAVAESWPVADVIRLLLAATKGRDHLGEANREALTKAEALVAPQLPELAAADVVKVALAASGHGPGSGGPSELLRLAAKEAVIRLPDFAPEQLFLVTEGLARGLDGGHASLLELMRRWRELLAKVRKPGKVPGQLAADQLVKLALALEPALKVAAASEGPGKQVQRRFAEAVGSQLAECVMEVSEPNWPLLKAQLNTGCLTGCSQRGPLLKALLKVRHLAAKGAEDEEGNKRAAGVLSNRAKKRRRKK